MWDWLLPCVALKKQNGGGERFIQVVYEEVSCSANVDVVWLGAVIQRADLLLQEAKQVDGLGAAAGFCWGAEIVRLVW